MSSMLVAADMLEEQGDSLCEILRRHTSIPMKSGGIARLLQSTVLDRTGVDISEDISYQAVLFHGMKAHDNTAFELAVVRLSENVIQKRHGSMVFLLKKLTHDVSVWHERGYRLDEINATWDTMHSTWRFGHE